LSVTSAAPPRKPRPSVSELPTSSLPDSLLFYADATRQRRPRLSSLVPNRQGPSKTCFRGIYLCFASGLKLVRRPCISGVGAGRHVAVGRGREYHSAPGPLPSFETPNGPNARCTLKPHRRRSVVHLHTRVTDE
jgi:hypothetical protein